MSPPNCIIVPLQSKVVDPTSTPSHYNKLSGYNHHILPFVDVMVKEGVEHVSHKEEEEGMKDDRGSYKASMHGSTLTTLNVLITLWTLIWASNFLLYFHLCPKTLLPKISTMLPSIQFSNLHEVWKYSPENA